MVFSEHKVIPQISEVLSTDIQCEHLGQYSANP